MNTTRRLVDTQAGGVLKLNDLLYKEKGQIIFKKRHATHVAGFWTNQVFSTRLVYSMCLKDVLM